jgi:hypothetical protein
MRTSRLWFQRSKSMRHIPKLAVPILVLLILAFISSSFAFQGKTDDAGELQAADAAYAIGLWGDLPYSDIQANVGVPNLIADMNSQRLAFSVHDGDLKQGSNSPCDDALYIRSLGYFNMLDAPAIFTPGDNDWTDCDRANNGGFSSLERLSHERQVFFSTPFTLGRRTFRQEVQSTPQCLGESNDPAHTRFPEPCVENRRWTYGRVTYATLNIQGSCNNLCDVPPTGDPDEYNARNPANITWMQETFDAAKANGSVAVMFISQADPGFDATGALGDQPFRNPMTLAETDAQPDGYQAFLLALREQIVAFQKPVAYVHGDSHYFRVDKPLQDSSGRRVENFTRVETFGDHAEAGAADVNWVKVLVDPKSREVFAFQAQIVPDNQTTAP